MQLVFFLPGNQTNYFCMSNSWVLFCSIVHMVLYQDVSNYTICLRKNVFTCKQYNVPLIEWTVRSKNRSTNNLIFQSTDRIGSIKSESIGNVSSTAKLVYVNNSFLETSLTLLSNINVSISCNDDSIYYIPHTSKFTNIYMRHLAIIGYFFPYEKVLSHYLSF